MNGAQQPTQLPTLPRVEWDYELTDLGESERLDRYQLVASVRSSPDQLKPWHALIAFYYNKVKSYPDANDTKETELLLKEKAVDLLLSVMGKAIATLDVNRYREDLDYFTIRLSHCRWLP
jgi:hypothetical protein